MTPYLAYWVPEHLGGSGVLATVAAGLYVSWKGPLLIPAATRLQGIFFWDLIIYLIEGFVFLLTGLQARTLIERIHVLTLSELLVAATLTTAIVILARFIWVFPAVYLPRWLSSSLARRDPLPPWQQTFVLAFTGVRGVVSLAAALAIPLTLADGRVFPNRDLILFIAFSVIIFTLVVLGLMLPAVIRWLGLARHSETEHQRERQAELVARREAIDAALRRLEELEAGKNIPKEVTELLRTRHDHRRRQLLSEELRPMATDLKLELIQIEREYIYDLLHAGRITDEARRKLERELDLEEASILSRRDEDIVPIIPLV
jgi:CPA1 family monovalent cation:H+ antiporter